DPSEKMIRQYLLGELSESEQTALEDECFADGAKYDRLLQAEDKLIDDYARGYLSAAERLQFERHFMGTPRRCEHVRFARAFTALLDQEPEAQAPPQTEQASPLHHPGAPVPWIQSLLDRLRPVAWPAFATALLLVVLGGLWFQRQAAHLREQLAQAQREREAQQLRTQMLEGQVSSQNEKNKQLAEELDRLRNQQSAGKEAPSPSVLLTLSLDAFRVPGGAPPRLVIPHRADLVRLRLKLTENVFPQYQITLQTADGKEVMSRKGLKAVRAKSGESLMLSIPSTKFISGEYFLALSGIGANGEVESLGKSVLEVKKQ